MPRLSPLPEQLRYLHPFRQQVAKLGRDEAVEDLDHSLLNSLLLERIHGLPVAEGKRKLQEDQSILEEWLSLANVRDNGSMFFLKGYLMALPELVDRLLEEKEKPREHFKIQMEFPDGARVKDQPGGGMKVNCFRATLFAFPLEARLVETQVKMLREPQHHRLEKVTVTQVAFGKAKGVKRVSHIPDVGSYDVDYVLEVPGGFAQLGVLRRGTPTPFDEARFEKYFHTIRITHGPR